VRLVAVSKLQSAEAIREAYALGQRDFGENYVQELSAKAEALADLPGLVWHFIGHLQRNKARHVARVAQVVHAIDSAELAAELGRRRTAQGGSPRLRALVEVKLSAEASKHGCAVGELTQVLEAVEAEPALELAGLMTVPPLTEEPLQARPYFERLAALQKEHGGAARLPELSMGMTADLELAIAAGATIVRVGTAIFGARARSPK
jgi:pyridoxal phosphate enzyme (YggS family)